MSNDSVFIDFRNLRIRCNSETLGKIIASTNFNDMTVYEFGDLLLEICENESDVADTALDLAFEKLKSQKPLLPFPRTAITWRNADFRMFAMIEEMPLEKHLATIIFAINEQKTKHWTVFPAVLAISRVAKSDENLIVLAMPDDVDANEYNMSEMEKIGGQVGAGILIGLELLSRPGVVIDRSLPSKESNLLRRLRKLPPITMPIHRVTHINRVVVRPPAETAGEHLGSPKSPHNRRSHLRHLKSGKVVAVRSMMIKGGSFDPRIVKVID